jgi:hypothetical protein
VTTTKDGSVTFATTDGKFISISLDDFVHLGDSAFPWTLDYVNDGGIVRANVRSGKLYLSTDESVLGVRVGPTPPKIAWSIVPTDDEDRHVPGAAAGITAKFSKSSVWEGGFEGVLAISNNTKTPLAGWTLSFDYPGEFTWLSDAVASKVPPGKWKWTPGQWFPPVPPGGVSKIGFGGTVGDFKNVKIAGGNPAPPKPTPPKPTPPKPTPPTPTPTPPTPTPTPPTPSAGVTAAFSKPSEWTGGFDGLLTIANNTTGPLKTWSLSFDYPGAFSWLTDASAKQVSPGKWVWSPGQWFAAVPPGGTSQIKFGGTVGGFSNVVIAASTAPPGPVPPSPVQWPERYAAPYVDTTLWPTPDLVAMSQATGVKFFTLAFITADSNKQPAWGGVAPLDSLMIDQIAALRAIGGDVSVSFGGANGQDMAQVIDTVDGVVSAYKKVIDVTGATRVDFDIEGAATADRVSVDRRNAALAKLNVMYPGLKMGYCLPVLPTGLTADGMYNIQSAQKYGVRLDHVRAMSMDFGGPYPDMATAVIQSAKSVKLQLESFPAYVNTSVGVIPMLGQNDVPDEVFGLDAARKFIDWANATRYVKVVSFWSMGRDKTGQLGIAACDGSGVPQIPWDFSKIFNAFK